VETHPAVLGARAKLDPLREQRASLEAERRRAFALTGAAGWLSGAPDPRLTATEEERLLAQSRLAEIDLALLKLRAQEAPAARSLAAAVVAARRELLETVDVERRKAVAKLDEILARAARANAELLALDEKARAVAQHTVPSGWHELREDSPTEATRLSAWRRSMREHKLL
jgi:hypothetical protein